jgi:hypothetical protein
MERQKCDLERVSDPVCINDDRVEFDGADDGYDPKNWSFSKKTLTTFLYGLTTLGSTWASAAYSPANETVARDFNISNEVAVLGTSVLLLGFVNSPCHMASLTQHQFWFRALGLGAPIRNLRQKVADCRSLLHICPLFLRHWSVKRHPVNYHYPVFCWLLWCCTHHLYRWRVR